MSFLAGMAGALDGASKGYNDIWERDEKVAKEARDQTIWELRQKRLQQIGREDFDYEEGVKSKNRKAEDESAHRRKMLEIEEQQKMQAKYRKKDYKDVEYADGTVGSVEEKEGVYGKVGPNYSDQGPVQPEFIPGKPYEAPRSNRSTGEQTVLNSIMSEVRVLQAQLKDNYDEADVERINAEIADLLGQASQIRADISPGKQSKQQQKPSGEMPAKAKENIIRRLQQDNSKPIRLNNGTYWQLDKSGNLTQVK